MATKTKTKDKLKESLKNVLLKELKDQKSEEREIRKKENANLQEVIMYTKFSCPFCQQMKDKLEDEGIGYTEKPQLENEKEWDEVATLTGMPIFPTLLVNGEYLVPRRDFQQIPQAVDLIKRLAQKDFKMPSKEDRVIEGIISLGGNIGQQFIAFSQQINQINTKLDPIISFIEKLKEEIESEDNNEE